MNAWFAPACPPRPPVGEVAELFALCRAQQRAALIGYLPAGYPTVARSRVLLRALLAAGVDLIELGLPRPSALDGPPVRAATAAAQAAGASLDDALDLVGEVSAAGGRVMVMGCWGPIQAYGPAAFAREVAAAGGLGVITPDLLPGSCGEARWREHTDDSGLARTYLAHPRDSAANVAAAAAASSGWLYVASAARTGGHAPGHPQARALVAQLRTQAPTLPIGVGFGVRTAAHAATVAGYADAVVVGSALLEAAQHGPAALERHAAELAAGVRRLRTPQSA